MSTTDKTTNEPGVKEVQAGEKPVEKAPEKTEEKPKVEEKALGEVLETEPKKPAPKPESVPFEVFEMSKKEVKDLKKLVKDLEKKIEEGADKGEISADIDAIADEFNVDKTFLRKIEKSLTAKIEAQMEDKISSKLRPIEEEKNGKKRDEVFAKHLDQILDNKPEFKGIVNLDVIKSLAYLPSNANKTLSQLIEETYGNAITGRRTIETTKPGGGKEPTELDFDRAKADPAYFQEVMANPDLKRKYNEGLAQRVML